MLYKTLNVDHFAYNGHESNMFETRDVCCILPAFWCQYFAYMCSQSEDFAVWKL